MNLFGCSLRGLLLGALCACFCGSAGAHTASEYVQDGLVFHFDGIENVGYGLPHASDTNRWVDLTGHGFDWTLTPANCAWESMGLRLLGKGKCGTMAGKTYADLNGKFVTLEFVYANNASNAHTIIYTPGFNANSAYLYTDSANHVGFWGLNGGTRWGYAAPLGSTNNYSVVYTHSGTTPTGVSNYRVALQEGVNNGMNDWWGVDSQICLGCRKDGERLANGRLLALRLYDRVLTDDERRANAMLDIARFNLPFLKKKIILRAEGDGQVAIDDGAFAKAVTNTISLADYVDLKTQAGASSKFRFWRTPTGPADLEDVKQANLHLNFESNADLELVAVFTSTGGSADENLFKYSFKGLINMWDGISNVGLDAAHDDAATVWKDLFGTADLTLGTDKASFTTNALVCPGKVGSAVGTKSVAGYKTIEIVMAPPGSGSQMVFTSGSTAQMIAGDDEAANMLEGSQAGPLYYTGTAHASFAFTYNANGVKAFYEDGVEKTEKNGDDGWSKLQSVVSISGRTSDNKYPYTGRIYAIRLYNRELSGAEIAQDAGVDGARFFGRTSGSTARIDVRGPGKVRVNGGAAMAEQEISPAFGDAVTLEAVPDSGAEFVAWIADGIEVTGTNLLCATFSFAFSASVKSVKAVFLSKSARIDRRVTDYSFDGLIGMWDGICNTGFGLPHDSTTNVWKDLAGSRDMPLVANAGVFTENALSCLARAGGPAAGPARNVLAGVKTVEIVCERDTFSCLFDNAGAPLVAFKDGRVEFNSGGCLYSLSTNCATLAVVTDPQFGGTLFENGAELWERDNTDMWKAGSLTFGGDAVYPATYGYKGRLFAVRAYNRALTPMELARHSDLDQRRFFDCEQVAADRGVRTNASGTVECLLRLSTSGCGSIDVDGQCVTSGDYWYPEGTSVTLTAQPEGDSTFLGWVEDDRRAIPLGMFTNLAVTVTITRKTAIGAAYVRNRVLRRASAASYVREGLTAQLDGRENTGLGGAHSVTTNRWTDLSGNGNDFALSVGADGANASWTATGLMLAGTGRAGWLASGAKTMPEAKVKTVEIVYANAAKRNGIVFSPGARGVYVYTDLNGHVGFRQDWGYGVPLGSTNTYSVVAENTKIDRMFRGGGQYKNDGMADYWKAGANLASFGACTEENVYGKGEVLAVRVYNRRLTGPERLLNAKLDAVRYLGERVPKPGTLLIVR